MSAPLNSLHSLERIHSMLTETALPKMTAIDMILRTPGNLKVILHSDAPSRQRKMRQERLSQWRTTGLDKLVTVKTAA